jgi:O-antigen/teichoic acid export membrane protein
MTSSPFSRYLRGIVTVLKGVIIGSGLTYLASPFILRLYDPAAIGVFQTVQAGVVVIGALATLSLHLNLLRVPEEDVPHVLYVTLLVVATVSAITLLAVMWFRFTGTESIQHWYPILWLVPLSIFILACSQALNNLMVRRNQLDIISNSKIAQSGGYVIAALAIGQYYKSALALLVADIIGRLLPLGYLAKMAKSLPGIEYFRPRHASISRVWQYRDVAIWSTQSSLIGAVINFIIPVMLLTSYDAATAGYFAVVDKLIGTPVALLSGSTGLAFNAEFSRDIHSYDSHYKLIKKLLAVKSAIAIVPTIILMVFGTVAIKWVAGAAWVYKFNLVAILMPMYFCSFVADSYSDTIAICNKSSWLTAIRTSKLIAMLSLWWVSRSVGLSSIMAFGLISIISVVATLATLALVIAILRGHGKAHSLLNAPI